MYIKKHNKSINFFIVTAIIGSCLANPQGISKPYQNSTNSLVLSDENKEILNNYENFMNINQFSKAIIFGNSPALSLINPSLTLPPYSSPWVSIGRTPQLETIQYFTKNSDLPIIFGKNYKTWDGVDVRTRSPYVYKYIGNNYTQIESNGLIAAIPSKNALTQNFIFSNFDIGKTAEFYRANNKVFKTKITAICPDNRSEWAKFKINTEHNFFYATLICGENLIPSVYLDGNFVNADFIEYK